MVNDGVSMRDFNGVKCADLVLICRRWSVRGMVVAGADSNDGGFVGYEFSFGCRYVIIRRDPPWGMV